MPRGRIHARAVGGAVVIEVDPLTAVDLAEALAAAHRDCDELAEDRPKWQADVTAILNAATCASAEAQRVDVPFLRLVGGPEAPVVGVWGSTSATGDTTSAPTSLGVSGTSGDGSPDGRPVPARVTAP